MTDPLVVDLAVLIAIGIALVRGWAHRSVREFCSLVGLGVGLLIAPLLTGPLADGLGSFTSFDLNVRRALAVAIVVALPSLAGAIVGVRLSRSATPRGPSQLDGTGGAMFAFIRAMTVVSLILYVVVTVSPPSGDEDSLQNAVEGSASGQLLAGADSPFVMLYESLIDRSDDLSALALWASQRSGFDEVVPGDRLAFAATDAKLRTSPDAERSMLRLLNRERTDRGLDELAWCDACARVARAHSKDMYRAGYFSHVDSRGDDPFDRMMAAEIPYGAAGENLSLAPSIPQAHKGLMDSIDHRENILRSLFDEVGIGCYRGPYGLMCTQVFRALV